MKYLIDSQKIISKLMHFCKIHNIIYLYGAGKYGKKLYMALRQAGIFPKGFVKSSGEPETAFGLSVSPVESFRFDENSGVIIAFKGANIQQIESALKNRADVFFLPDGMFANLMQAFLIENIFKSFCCSKPSLVQEPNKWKNILIIRLDVIGDLIMTTPFIRELYLNCPRSRITLLINKSNEMLFHNCPYISELITYEPCSEDLFDTTNGDISYIGERVKKFASTHFRHIHYDIAFLPRQLFAGRYAIEELILLCASYSKSLVCRVNNRCNGDILQKFFSSVVYEIGEKSEVQYMLDILTNCGCSISNDKMEIWTNDEEKEYARIVLKSFQFPYRIAIGLMGRNEPKKNWPVENYREFISRMIEKYGCQIGFILFGDNTASTAANVILKAFSLEQADQILNLTGKTNLGEAAAVMEKCTIYVGAESGIKHMAAACSLPVVELSYSLPDSTIDDGSDPRRFGAWGVPRIVLRPSKGLDGCKGSCRKNYPHCITQITVNEVEEAADEFLSQKMKE